MSGTTRDQASPFSSNVLHSATHQVASQNLQLTTSSPHAQGRLQRPAAACLNLSLDVARPFDFNTESSSNKDWPPNSTSGQATGMSFDHDQNLHGPIVDSQAHRDSSPYSTDAQSPLSSTASDSSPPTPSDTEDSWNLIPYHIPWGSSYHKYEAGTLPGPEGACIFLRSPTPLKNQRTTQACEKCRERKAKCSGAKPSCARCQARGHICTYVSDPLKRVRGTNLGRRRRRDTLGSYPSRDSSETQSVDDYHRRNSNPHITTPSHIGVSPLQSHDPSRLDDGQDRRSSVGKIKSESEYYKEESPVFVFEEARVPQQRYEDSVLLTHMHQEVDSERKFRMQEHLAVPNFDSSVYDGSHNYGAGAPALFASAEQQEYGQHHLTDYRFPHQSIYAPRPMRHSMSMPFLPQSTPPETSTTNMGNDGTAPSLLIPMTHALSLSNSNPNSASPSVVDYSHYAPDADPAQSLTFNQFQQVSYFSGSEYHFTDGDHMNVYEHSSAPAFISPNEHCPVNLYADDGLYTNTNLPPPHYPFQGELPAFVQTYLGSS